MNISNCVFVAIVFFKKYYIFSVLSLLLLEIAYIPGWKKPGFFREKKTTHLGFFGFTAFLSYKFLLLIFSGVFFFSLFYQYKQQ